MIKTIFFDLYQTLLDVNLDIEKKKQDDAESWAAFASSLEQYDLRVSPEEMKAAYEKERDAFYTNDKDTKIHHHDLCDLAAKVLREQFNLSLSREQVVKIVYEYRKISRGYARLYPGAYQILEKLKEKYTLAAASHTQGSFTQIELEELGIAKFFSFFFYTSDIGFRKDTRRFYDYCLKATGNQPSECVMVGDNYDVDVLVPEEVGIKSVWIINPQTSNRYKVDSTPKYSLNIGELEKLPDLIETVSNNLT